MDGPRVKHDARTYRIQLVKKQKESKTLFPYACAVALRRPPSSSTPFPCSPIGLPSCSLLLPPPLSPHGSASLPHAPSHPGWIGTETPLKRQRASSTTPLEKYRAPTAMRSKGVRRPALVQRDKKKKRVEAVSQHTHIYSHRCKTPLQRDIQMTTPTCADVPHSTAAHKFVSCATPSPC